MALINCIFFIFKLNRLISLKIIDMRVSPVISASLACFLLFSGDGNFHSEPVLEDVLQIEKLRIIDKAKS